MYLATVITVFAGFLFSALAVAGNPKQIPKGTWRYGEMMRASVEDKLLRGAYLFGLYLITLAILFVGILVTKSTSVPTGNTQTMASLFADWIDRLAMFFGVTSFLLTFGLPIRLVKSQMRSFDSEIDERRQTRSRDEQS